MTKHRSFLESNSINLSTERLCCGNSVPDSKQIELALFEIVIKYLCPKQVLKTGNLEIRWR